MQLPALSIDNKKMAENLKSAKKIKVDVGGTIFTTSISTLTSVPDSKLAALFSGSNAIEQDADGTYFIDRNGSTFGYILDYLRDKRLPNIAPNHKAALFYEAIFYGLKDLVELIGNPIEEGTTSQVDLNKLIPKRISISGLDIRGRILAGLNLRGVDFSNAKMSGIKLTSSTLNDAIFIGTNLSWANCSGSSFIGAIFSKDTNFEGSDLSKANLTGANLSGVNFTGADLTGTILDNTVLENADFTDAKLEGVSTKNAKLRGAKNLKLNK